MAWMMNCYYLDDVIINVLILARYISNDRYQNIGNLI